MEQGISVTSEDSATIYVVEDEEALLELVGLTLANGPWQVKRFGTAEEALRSFVAEASKPVLLLTDYDLGTSDGLTLAAECHKIHPRLKVILMSGTVTSEIVEDSPVSLECFVPKPFRPHQLREIVSAALASA